jgi:hypothetical protein
MLQLTTEIDAWADGPWTPRKLPPSWTKTRAAATNLVQRFVVAQGVLQRSGTGHVVATYGCPAQLGNRMHEHANGFALAVVAHRPLLSLFIRATYYPVSEARCERILHRRNWTRTAGMTPATRPLTYLREASEPERAAALLLLLLMLLAAEHLHGRYLRRKFEASRRIACGGGGLVRAPFDVELGSAAEWQQAAALGAADARLPPEAHRRAKARAYSRAEQSRAEQS